MPATYRLSQIRLQLDRTCPQSCPEIYTAFQLLDEDDQEWILAHVQALSNSCRQMGAVSALELVYKLGRFMQVGISVYPCCGKPMRNKG